MDGGDRPARAARPASSARCSTTSPACAPRSRDLALQIFAIVDGERAYEDLYLYRTQVAPRAAVMLERLARLTEAQELAARRRADACRGRHRERARTVAGAVGLLALAVGGVAWPTAFAASIVAPVRRLTAVAERVAAGDLSARATPESHDEIGVLGTSINTMTQRLSDIDRPPRVGVSPKRSARATPPRWPTAPRASSWPT